MQNHTANAEGKGGPTFDLGEALVPKKGLTCENQIKIVESLLQTSDKTIIDASLPWAIWRRVCVGVLEALIKAGPDVNSSEDGEPLIVYASAVGTPEAVKALIDAGANVNAKGENDITPLMEAVLYGRVGTAKVLLDAGADVNAQNERGMNALMQAAKNIAGMVATGTNNSDNIKLLIKSGANLLAKDKSNRTALDYAIERGIQENIALISEALIEKYPEQANAIKALIEKQGEEGQWIPQNPQSWTEWIKQNSAISGASALASAVGLAVLWSKLRGFAQPAVIPAQVGPQLPPHQMTTPSPEALERRRLFRERV